MPRAAKKTTREQDVVLKRRVLDAAPLLAPNDRQLVQQYFWRELRMPELAHLRRSTVRTMQRQIDRICRRVANPTFDLFLKYQSALPAELRMLARDHFLYGYSLRAIAAKRQWSLYRAHHEVNRIRVILLLAKATPRPEKVEG